MRNCRKCGEIIPNRIKIEDKICNLRNRKFCLKCSPFRGHNTSPDDPIRRKARNYKNYTEKQKDCVKMCLYRRALERRYELLKLAGYKCIKCGYCTCTRALSFHHKDPKSKLFGLSLNNLWMKTWEAILAEFEKCELLCMNCHAELEDQLARTKANYVVAKINAKYGTNY